MIAAVVLAGATGNLDALLAEAAKARNAGDYAASLEAMSKAHAIEPAPELLNNIAWLLAALGRYDQAVDTYRSIAADPAVPARLRQLDRARVAELTPKLQHAWLRVTAPQSSLQVDGKAAAIGAEVAASPGQHVVVIRRLGMRDAILRTVELTRARRLDLALDPSALDPDSGRLLLEGLELSELGVDGHVMDARGLRTLRLRAGEHRLRLLSSGRQPVELTVAVKPRSTLSLTALLAGDAPQYSPEPNLVTDAPGPNLGPPITTVLGAVLGGVATGLLVYAEADRDTVRDATREADGTITALTLREADALERRANQNATIGLVFAGAGAAALISGLIWWLAGDDEAPPAADPSGGVAAWRF